MEIFLPIAHMDINLVVILMFGVMVGFLSGLVGVGGGFLITPLLIFTGVPPIVAVATGSAQMAGTSAGATYSHWRLGNVDFRMGVVLLIGSWIGGASGVQLANVLTKSGQFGNIVTFLYVALLGVIGVSMMIESVKVVFGITKPATAETTSSDSVMAKLMHRLPWRVKFAVSGLEISVVVPLILGVMVGVLTSLMGVGGGFVMVPVMIYLLKMPTKIVVGTSLFQLLFTTMVVSVMQAGVNHAVDPFLALILILGSAFGTQWGARAGMRLPAEKLRLILALVVVAVAIKMLFGLLMTPDEVFSLTRMVVQ